MEGIVKHIVKDKQFGFIIGNDKQEYFFHASSVQNGKFTDIREGFNVEFEETDGQKGLRAEDVFIR